VSFPLRAGGVRPKAHRTKITQKVIDPNGRLC
jgi:hypothetical protein